MAESVSGINHDKAPARARHRWRGFVAERRSYAIRPRVAAGPTPTPASMSLRRFSPTKPNKPARPRSPHSPVLSLCWSVLLLLPLSANVVVVDAGADALCTVALATPAPPNNSAPVAETIAMVLRMFTPEVYSVEYQIGRPRQNREPVCSSPLRERCKWKNLRRNG